MTARIRHDVYNQYRGKRTSALPSNNVSSSGTPLSLLVPRIVAPHLPRSCTGRCHGSHTCKTHPPHTLGSVRRVMRARPPSTAAPTADARRRTTSPARVVPARTRAFRSPFWEFRLKTGKFSFEISRPLPQISRNFHEILAPDQNASNGSLPREGGHAGEARSQHVA